VLGAGLSAVLTWPTYLSLKLTSAAGDKFSGKIAAYYDLFDYIASIFCWLTRRSATACPISTPLCSP
jgi:hypothetical protein